jgi:DNA-binding transcriptional LysR family regulator
VDLNKVDLNLFVVLDSIYTESSLSGAAKRLYVTQPAVSAALSRLRDVFNDPLFVRTGRRMVPTPTTESIIGQVREALALIRTSVDKSYHSEPDKEQKVIRLSMNDHNEYLVIPRLYPILEQQAPNMKLQTVQLNRRDAIKSLSAGQLDFVLDAPLLSDEQLCHQPLFDDRYVCVVRKDHPIGDSTLSVESYVNLAHVHISSRPSGPGYVDYALEKLNLARRIVVRTQHYLMVPRLVTQTNLAATVPSTFANIPGAKMLELPIELQPQGAHLYWHRSRDADPVIQWLKKILLDILVPKQNPEPELRSLQAR